MVGGARGRGLRVIVAGHDAADNPALHLDAGASFVIVGEAEVPLAELLDRMDAVGGADALIAQGAEEIEGLAFRQRGFVRRTGRRKLLADLDQLPLSAWDLVDVARYRAHWLRRHGYFSLNVV